MNWEFITLRKQGGNHETTVKIKHKNIETIVFLP